MIPGNVFENIAEDIPGEILEDLLVRPGVRIERIVSNGHSSPIDFWYDQDTDEWILVLKGQAAIRFQEGDKTIELREGSFINIPAHIKHRVDWTAEDTETIWLAIHY